MEEAGISPNAAAVPVQKAKRRMEFPACRRCNAVAVVAEFEIARPLIGKFLPKHAAEPWSNFSYRRS